MNKSIIIRDIHKLITENKLSEANKLFDDNPGILFKDITKTVKETPIIQ